MADITLTPLVKPVTVKFSGTVVRLPKKLSQRVNSHWQTLTRQNPHLFNGEAFTVTSFRETSSEFQVELAETNYAHTLYCEAYDAGEHAFRVIHSATLVVTNDNKLVVGQMSQHTARGGVISCSGGGIDRGDLRGDMIDLDHSSAHELREELGIDPYANHVTAFFPAYLKTGGPTGKMTVLYELHTGLQSQEFAENYQTFIDTLDRKNEKPEYTRLFYIDNTPTAVEAFITQYGSQLDEYLPKLLRISAQKISS